MEGTEAPRQSSQAKRPGTDFNTLLTPYGISRCAESPYVDQGTTHRRAPLLGATLRMTRSAKVTTLGEGVSNAHRLIFLRSGAYVVDVFASTNGTTVPIPVEIFKITWYSLEDY
jgi:hypothetical protein